tara:strand:- start:160 stop:855 length:696 start_codon:yes stop_codon:yes gene_type:complete
MTDSLQLILDAINANNLNDLEIIDKIDSFYNNAWNKLIFIITIGFAIVGVIIPIFIQWLQKNTLKTSEELLKIEIENKTAEIEKEITTKLLLSIDQKFKEYEKEIVITRASGKAKAYFSEGKYNLEKNEYDRALADFINSGYACTKSNDHKTLQDIIKYILENCLPYLSQEEINDLKIANNGDLVQFLDHLTEVDDRDVFQTNIGAIRVKITKLPKSIKDKPSEQSKKSSN